MPSRLTDDDRLLIEEQVRLAERARTLVTGARDPYLAHMRIAAEGGQRDVLLGLETRWTPEVALVDWRTAPLAEVFFAYEPGEAYAVELEGRTLEGRLLARHLVAFEDGEVVEIEGPDRVLTRRGGAWRRRPRPPMGLRPRDPEDRGAGHSPLDVILDPVQEALVELPPERALLVLGEAGFGKTTVALHRLARLRRRAEGRFRAAVVVPTEGLRRLTEAILARLGAKDVEVWLYDRFAAAQARRAFPGLPRRESRDASAGVIRLKRHPALRDVLGAVADRPRDADEADPPGRRRVRRRDLEHLFGDRDLLRRVAEASGGEVTGYMVDQTLDHTRVQFTDRTEIAFAHVDADRLTTLDGREIDEATPMQDAGSIDVEDYAVLFELDRLRARAEGRRPQAPRRFDCLVLDEAQELAPLELALVGRSVARHGTLVVAGDAGQQVDPTAAFAGWDETLAELGAHEHEVGLLEASYRCPPEVTALARRILDPDRPEAGPPPREDVVFARHDSPLHLTAWLVEALAGLRAEDPGAAVAIIARTPEGARRLARGLRLGLDVRLVLDGAFEPRPGIDVTCVQEAKGLEFDYVVVPDAGPETYPDTPAGRRALYVAVTRAIHQTALATVGGWSKIVAPLLPAADPADAAAEG